MEVNNDRKCSEVFTLSLAFHKLQCVVTEIFDGS